MRATNAKINPEREKKNDNKALVIAAVIVVLTFVVTYLRDQQQQRNLKLRTLEARIEALEERGPSMQNRQQKNTGGW